LTDSLNTEFFVRAKAVNAAAIGEALVSVITRSVGVSTGRVPKSCKGNGVQLVSTADEMLAI